MTSQIRGILFDKDGTLIDFTRTWLPLYQAAAAHLSQLCDNPNLADLLLRGGGYQPESNSWQADSLLASGSNTQILDAWERESGIDFDAKVMDELQSIFVAGNTEIAPVIENLRPYMLSLRNKGYKLGVATMDDEAHALRTLAALNIDDLMDFVCGADSGFGLKPDAGMVNAFCEKCTIKACDVVMVGDSPRDLKMASNAGCSSAIGVLTGASTTDDLSPFTHHVLNSIAELPDLLDKLAR